jgi:hypothetical protein
MPVFKHSFSPIRIFTGCAAIGIAVVIYMMLHPKLTVEPVPSPNQGVAFGTIFDLSNQSIAVLYRVSYTYCVNSLQTPGNIGEAEAGALRLETPSQSISLANLSRGDATALPILNAVNAPPGSEVDLVFAVRFQPESFRFLERRFRFLGTEDQDGTWIWKQVPLGSPCG